jgi:drug/metabolite transporter (DMT)-like permease
MDPRTRSRLKLVAAALLFSTGGAAIKAIPFTSWQVAALRSGIAAAILALVGPGARRGWSWRTPIVGVAYAATLILFVLANKLTTSANAIFLQSTAPLYLLIVSPLLLREPVTREDLIVMLLVGSGLAMFFVGHESASATAPDPAFGNLLAAASGLTWALTVAGLRWLGAHGTAERGGAMPAVVAGNAFAFLLCLPMATPFSAGSTESWILTVYLGVFQIGVAYLFVTEGLRRVPALEASVLLLVEPAFNPIWAWLVHNERPGPWALVGGIVIVSATTGKAIYDSRAVIAGSSDGARSAAARTPGTPLNTRRR